MTEHEEAFKKARSLPAEQLQQLQRELDRRLSPEWQQSVQEELQAFEEKEPKARELLDSDWMGAPPEVVYLLLQERHEEALLWQVRQLDLELGEWLALTYFARDMVASRKGCGS